MKARPPKELDQLGSYYSTFAILFVTSRLLGFEQGKELTHYQMTKF